MQDKVAFELKDVSAFTSLEDLWNYCVDKALVPANLPMIQMEGEILLFDVRRFIRSVSCAFAKRFVCTEELLCSHRLQVLLINLVNKILLEIAEHQYSCLEAPYLDKLIGNAMQKISSNSIEEKKHMPSVPLAKNSFEQLVVLRRNGCSVVWDSEKVVQAVFKCMIAQNMKDEKSALCPEVVKQLERQAHVIANRVTGHILALGRLQIHLEEIQDCVESTLGEMGMLHLARAYAAYREERFLLRKRNLLIESKGFLSDLIDSDLLSRIDIALIGLKVSHTRDFLAKELVRTMSTAMSPQEKAQTVVLNARTLMECDAEYRFFAARILLTYIYEEVLDWSVPEGMVALKQAHVRGFTRYVERGVELGLLDKRFLSMNLKRLASFLNPLADFQFDYLGICTLCDRYFLQEREVFSELDKSPVLSRSGRRRLEVPQYMWMRVAIGLSFLEKDPETVALAYYSQYTSKRFCSATPTLFNSGTTHPQLASCFGLTCLDEIASLHKDEEGRHYPVGIFGIYTECASISKYAGGLGVDFTAVRGKGSHIRGTNGVGLGVVPFLRILNDLALAVNQGGRRRGVICAYLETWHNDIEDFLELRKATGDERSRTHDLHTANWIPDLFLKRAIRGEEWTLFHSNEVPDLHELYGKAFEKRYVEYEQMAKKGQIYGKAKQASSLWKKMLEMLFETGHPWITFKDPSNIRSTQDHVGVVHSLNLCTEITLNTSRDEHFVCNLGSIHLPVFVDCANRSFFWDQLSDTVRIAVRMLDNVIDLMFYPTIPAEKANKAHRPLGLGMMGWQDVLHLLQIPFESEEMVALADKVTEFISWHACYASVELAKEKGPYSSFKGSKWDRGFMPLDTLALLDQERGIVVNVDRTSWMDWESMRELIKKHGIRNSTLLSIAPTASISNIFGCAPSIEPDYRQLFTKSTLSGEQLWLNPHLVKKLKELELWDKNMLESIKYAKGELSHVAVVPEEVKIQFKNAFAIDQMYLIRAAAVRQKWVDQAISLNLFLGDPDLKLLSQLYLQSWLRGLKSCYYLKTKSASDIEDVTLSIKKKVKEIEKTKDPVLKSFCSLDDSECESCQ